MQIKKFTRILPRKIYKVCIFISVIVVFVSAFLALSSFSANAASFAYVDEVTYGYGVSGGIYNSNDPSNAGGYGYFDKYVLESNGRLLVSHYDLYGFRYEMSERVAPATYIYNHFKLANSRIVLQGGSTYRFQFVIVTNKQDLSDSINHFMGFHSYLPDGKNWIDYSGHYGNGVPNTYFSYNNETVCQDLSPVTSFTVNYFGSRFIGHVFDFTLSVDYNVNDLFIQICQAYGYTQSGSITDSQLTTYCSPLYVYEVYEDAANAPVYPDNDISGSDDLNNAENELNDFSKDSGASDFLDSSHLSSFVGPEYLAGMDGISEYMQYLYSQWPWIQTIVYVSVSLGIVALLFNLGAAFLSRRK